ncbi:TetR/AcrR family transcriptional regulator [Dyella tabacisoli]|uniref:TetR/AcrR family transcriptional regulator n=2 Tax=Dyella tabacisoli TaxID=2282381 RepID=A0A369UMM5_9GAMM|nr:TetR/AcrR family transcriptional regulator [Dyella tabacisoli]RDD80968.1 TetR/AcrR family transcriptional regulator [Dyella tabacisoli]
MVQKETKKPRGRPRAYDPDQALTDAMGTFWRAGYAGTSLDDLSEATGMNRPSLYSAFGDKHGLYLQTLDRYIAESIEAIDGALADDVSLPKALMRLYDRALSLYLPADADARGCFLIGTAATEAVVNAEVRTKLGEALRAFDYAIEVRLRLARTRGELAADADPVVLAKIASAVLHTLALRSRTGDTRKSLRATAIAGVQLICGTAADTSKRAAKPRAASSR